MVKAREMIKEAYFKSFYLKRSKRRLLAQKGSLLDAC